MLKIWTNTSKIKVDNSQTKQVDEIAKNVRVCLGDYESQMDLMVIEIDEFELIICDSFMRIAGMRVFLQLESVMVMNKASPSFVHG